MAAALLFGLCLLPLARWFVLGFTDNLGANPVEFVTRSSGTWTLVMLCVTLAITPLRQLTQWGALIRYRRMLGLFTFFYACLHLLTYVWFDQWFDAAAMVQDILKRPFITAGFVAFLLMLPLAVTSNRHAIRALGRRWGLMHRMVYIVAIAALLHFWWHRSGKNHFDEPIVYSVIVAALLGWRLVDRWRRSVRR